MNDLERLQLVAERLLHDRDDLRHTVLEVSANFLAATETLATFPPVLHEEFGELRAEIEAVQPRFPSHRRTSILFDDAGLGRPGRDRARTIADRIVAVARTSE